MTKKMPMARMSADQLREVIARRAVTATKREEKMNDLEEYTEYLEAMLRCIAPTTKKARQKLCIPF